MVRLSRVERLAIFSRFYLPYELVVYWRGPIWPTLEFGMKLNSENRQFLVFQSHNDPIIGTRCDSKAFGKTFRIHNQRMVTCSSKRTWQTDENTGSIVENLRSFSMHQFLCPKDLSAESLTNGLMTETYSENRKFPFKLFDYR